MTSEITVPYSFTELSEMEIREVHGGIVDAALIAAATAIATFWGACAAAGWAFGKSLAEGNKKKAAEAAAS